VKTEKGIAAVVYKKSRGSLRVLILHRKKNWEGWELLKGHLENGDYEETVRLELEEEAGIDTEEIQNTQELDHTVEWSYEEEGEKIKREYRGFLVRVEPETGVDVTQNPHDEHESGFFMKPEDAEALLTHDNQKKLLEEALGEIS
jgi:8-oxo-dGTP pyrophosphatase MutT (NUDIX family)